MNFRQAPLLLLALLLAFGGALSAQEDAGHRAEPPSMPDPAPVEAPSPPDVSEPPSQPESPDTPVESPEAPAEPSSDSEPSSESPSGRYAVPVDTPVEPHRQPPSRGGHDHPNPPSGGGDDGYVPEEPYIEVEADEPYYDPSGGWFSLGRWFGGRPDAGGALDLDVSPGRTQVYLDGQYVGIVDRFDGWPGYLWLEEGTYEIVFYLDGYRTRARRVTVRPGITIVLDDRLVPGPSIRPEEFAPPRR